MTLMCLILIDMSSYDPDDHFKLSEPLWANQSLSYKIRRI
jgi:hypothetical protein